MSKYEPEVMASSEEKPRLPPPAGAAPNVLQMPTHSTEQVGKSLKVSREDFKSLATAITREKDALAKVGIAHMRVEDAKKEARDAAEEALIARKGREEICVKVEEKYGFKGRRWIIDFDSESIVFG